jgi:hypothetical protein
VKVPLVHTGNTPTFASVDHGTTVNQPVGSSSLLTKSKEIDQATTGDVVNFRFFGLDLISVTDD